MVLHNLEIPVDSGLAQIAATWLCGGDTFKSQFGHLLVG